MTQLFRRPDHHSRAKAIAILMLTLMLAVSLAPAAEGSDDTNFKLYGIGENSKGQLGIGSGQDTSIPTRVVVDGNNTPVTDVTKVVNTRFNTFFITSDGKLYGMGNNSSGQLGLPDIDSYVSVATQITQVKEGNDNVTLGKVVDVVCSGTGSNNSFKGVTFFITSDGKLYGMGDNEYGQQGNGESGSNAKVTIPTVIGQTKTVDNEDVFVPFTNVSHVVCSPQTTFFITSDGKLYGMGYNALGQQGNGNNNNVNIPTQITQVKQGSNTVTLDKKVTDVVCSNNTTFFITSDGKLYGTGANGLGQQGNGNTNSVNRPTQITQVKHGSDPPVTLDKKVTDVVCSTETTFFITSDGKLYGTGRNNYGQQGNGDTSNVTRPTQIGSTLGTITNVVCSTDTTFFITSDGKLYGMGSNEKGQQGNGKSGFDFNVNTPTRIDKDNEDNTIGTVVDVQCTGSNTFLITSDGELYGIGVNNSGQLGSGGDKTRPIRIDSNLGVITNITCSFSNDGSVLFTTGRVITIDPGEGEYSFPDKIVRAVVNSDSTLTYQSKENATKSFVKPTKTDQAFKGLYSGNVKVIGPTGSLIPGVENYTDENAEWIGGSGIKLSAQYGQGYTVTLNENYTGSVNRSFNAYEGSDAKTNYTAPVRTGYVFEGYYAEELGEHMVIGADGEYAVYGNLTENDGSAIIWKKADNTTTLYAKWVPVEYTVTLKEKYSTDRSFTAIYNSDVLKNYLEPVLNGYTFEGYYADENYEENTLVIDTDGKYVACDYSSSTYTAGTPVVWKYPAPVTLYAKWALNTYTLTLNKIDPSNIGGFISSSQEPTTSYVGKYDTLVSFTADQIWFDEADPITATTSTVPNYTSSFSWSTTQPFKMTGDVKVTGTFTLTPVDYMVTVSPGDHGTIGTSDFTAPYASEIVNSGKTLSVGGTAVNVIPSTGYELTSWSIIYNTTSYIGDKVPGNISVTPQFAPIEYTVNLDDNYGNGTVKTFKATYDSDVLKSYSAPYRPDSGYDFMGYYAEKTGVHQIIGADGKYVEYSAYTAKSGDKVVWQNANAPITLYAKWKYHDGDYKYVINYEGETIKSVDVYISNNDPIRITASKDPIWNFDKETGRGPFNSYYAAVDRVDGTVVFELNPYNLKQKLDGSSYTMGNYNIVWFIPTVYWKVVGNSLILSNIPSEGTPYAHTAGGVVYAGIGIGVYEASRDTSDSNKVKLMSKSGATPSQKWTIATYTGWAHNTAGDAIIWNYYQWTFTKMATYMVGMGKNTQSIWGNGNVSSSGASKPGLGDTAGPYVSGQTSYSKVFIENSWGSLSEFLGDTVSIDSVLYAGQNLSGISYDSKNKVKYSDAKIPKNTGGSFIKTTYKNAAYWDLPSALGGTSGGSPGDKIYSNTGTRILPVGGDYKGGSSAGISYIQVDQGTGTYQVTMGTRLAYFFYPSYIVSLDMNSGSSNITKATVVESKSTITYRDADSISKSFAKPTKTGYTFDGFYTESVGGTCIIDSSGAFVKGVAGYTDSNGKWIVNRSIAEKGITLFAHYSPNNYTVTLNKNYSGSTQGSFTATYDSDTLTGYPNPDQRTGYVFGGYFADTENTKKVIDKDGKYAVQDQYTKTVNSKTVWQRASATTLYAKWIDLKAEGGSKVYDGELPILTIKDGDKVLTSGFTVRYYSDPDHINEMNVSETKNAGIYYIEVTGTGDYEGCTTYAVSTITKKTLTITAGNASIIMEYNNTSVVDKSFFSIDGTGDATLKIEGLVTHEMPRISTITANFFKDDTETGNIDADRVKVTEIEFVDSTVPTGFKAANYSISGLPLDIIDGQFDEESDRIVHITTKHVVLITALNTVVEKVYDGSTSVDSSVVHTHLKLDHIASGDSIGIDFTANFNRADIHASKVILTDIHVIGDSSDNYEVNTRAELPGTILKAAPSLDSNIVPATEIEYNETPRYLIADPGMVKDDPGNPSEKMGTIMYLVSTRDDLAGLALSGQTFYPEGDDNLKRVDLGSYYVYYMIKGGLNYNDYYCLNSEKVQATIV